MSRRLDLTNTGRPRIAVVMTRPQDLKNSASLVRQGADLIELRLDHFLNLGVEPWIAGLKKYTTCPVLVTIRHKREGGNWQGSDTERLKWFKQILPYADAVDIELSSSKLIKPLRALTQGARKKLVISFHDFEKTPSLASLIRLARRAGRAQADAFKVATQINRVYDIQTLTNFIYHSPFQPVIALGMGPKGIPSRTLFPLIGSLWTYAHSGKSTAPGQLSLTETIRELKKHAL